MTDKPSNTATSTTEVDSDDDIFESEEYDYKFKYMKCVTFESKYIIIADGKCQLDGKKHLGKFDWKKGEAGDFETNYHMSGPIRNKEDWYCFLKYKDMAYEDDEYNINMLDLILINSKLYESLPEPFDFDKLEELSWEGEGEVSISSDHLVAFDGEYFNNVDRVKLSDNIKKMEFPWYEYISRTLMKNKESILINDHGVALFLDNSDYTIYSIKDDKSDQILALDIEICSSDNYFEDDSNKLDLNKLSKII